MIETVCFTGHRYMKKALENWAHDALLQATERAVNSGANWFMSGGAPYWDWWFLSNVKYARAKGELDGWPDGVIVGAALPFPEFWEYYKDKRSDDRIYIKNELENGLDIIIHVNEEGYSPWKMHARNRWLVDNHDMVMAVYDGRTNGGTFQTLKYAREKGKPILWLDPKLEEERWINV